MTQKGGKFAGLLFGEQRGSFGPRECQEGGADPVFLLRLQSSPVDLPAGFPELGASPANGSAALASARP